jgi:hypothetical protein
MKTQLNDTDSLPLWITMPFQMIISALFIGAGCYGGFQILMLPFTYPINPTSDGTWGLLLLMTFGTIFAGIFCAFKVTPYLFRILFEE